MIDLLAKADDDAQATGVALMRKRVEVRDVVRVLRRINPSAAPRIT
jgi:hypothetical protein